MTEASIPPQPTRSPSDADGGAPAAAPDTGLDGLDDLVIEDLTGASWSAVAPRICICTFSGE
ncbi:hypothetical protein ACH4TX_31175 [Streptomyces sp. NPDC021098]|uniref:hypothetical protein n=1 Tax=unclassified Streptomyces TaxID=2593676 RepID=UPI00379ADF8C